MHDAGSYGVEWLDSSDDGEALLVEQLFDAGYDVWIANLRGTLPSREHETLDSDSADYWDFDLDAWAYEDLPAIVAEIQA